MSDPYDYSNYFSNEFNTKLRILVPNIVKRRAIHELIDAEVDDLLIVTCQECDLHRRYNR